MAVPTRGNRWMYRIVVLDNSAFGDGHLTFPPDWATLSQHLCAFFKELFAGILVVNFEST